MRDFDQEWKRMDKHHDRITNSAIIAVVVGWIVTLGVIGVGVAVVTHFVWGWP